MSALIKSGRSRRMKSSNLKGSLRPKADVRISLNLAPHVCLRTRLCENAKRQKPVVNCTGSRDFPTPTWEIRISSETPLPSPQGPAAPEGTLFQCQTRLEDIQLPLAPLRVNSMLKLKPSLLNTWIASPRTFKKSPVPPTTDMRSPS